MTHDNKEALYALERIERDYCQSLELWTDALARDAIKTTEFNMRVADIKSKLEFIETIRAALQRPAVPEWQPIDTAPRDGTEVIIGKMLCGFWHQWVGKWDGTQWDRPDDPYARSTWFISHGNTVQQPTRWVPLPAAPKQGVE